MSKESVSVRDRNIYFNGEVEELSIGVIQEAIIQLNQYDNEEEDKLKDYERKPIHLFINSRGGDIYPMFGLIDIILNSKTPIYTYNNGLCCSAGFKIFLAGHKRFARKHSTFLYHQIQTSNWYNNLQTIKEDVNFKIKLQTMIEDFVLSRTKFTKEFIDNVREKKLDYYFLVDEALDKGCIEEII